MCPPYRSEGLGQPRAWTRSVEVNSLIHLAARNQTTGTACESLLLGLGDSRYPAHPLYPGLCVQFLVRKLPIIET